MSAQPRDNRAHPRATVMRRGALVDATGRTQGCVIVDFSLGGARLQIFAPGGLIAPLSLLDRRMGMAHDLRIVWRHGAFLGVAFTTTTELPVQADG